MSSHNEEMDEASNGRIYRSLTNQRIFLTLALRNCLKEFKNGLLLILQSARGNPRGEGRGVVVALKGRFG